ncbi:hypothetical protein [Mucisphaera sp.]|uniref:hypothetical protein n=1 Tax=Mucisphaera sp. TaxID=2913024 RepID=UPI003D0E4811
MAVNSIQDGLAYPSIRSRWHDGRVAAVLPIAPWIAVNRGAHAWGWPGAAAAHLVGLVGWPLWYAAPELLGEPGYLMAIILLIELVLIAAAGGLQVWTHLDGKSLRTYLLAIKRVYLLMPFLALFGWCVWGVGWLLVTAQFGLRDAYYETHPEQRDLRELQRWLIEAISYVGLWLAVVWPVLVTLLTVRAGRPGWSSRWPAHCEKCDYTLLGLEPHASCPECGEPVVNSLVESPRQRRDPAYESSSLWKRGRLVLRKPTKFGEMAQSRSPERIPWVSVVVWLLSVVLVMAYTTSIYAYSRQYSANFGFGRSISPEPYELLEVFTFGALRDFRGIDDFFWIVVWVLAWLGLFYSLCLLGLLSSSLLLAERAGGNRGYGPLRQAVYASPGQLALAIFFACVLFIWSALAEIWTFLNPLLMFFEQLGHWGLSIPESLTDLAWGTPWALFFLWCIGFYGWYTYALSCVARAARYANA